MNHFKTFEYYRNYEPIRCTIIYYYETGRAQFKFRYKVPNA